MNTINEDIPFYAAFRGYLKGIKGWQDLDTLLNTLEATNDGRWYIYTLADQPPETPAATGQFRAFLHDTNQLLRQRHQEDYCGIVYVDNVEQPQFVKIYDPDNLGVVCGFSDNPPLPGWILSREKPCDLNEPEPVSFWQKCLHKFG